MDLFNELLTREKQQKVIPGILTAIVKENWDEEHKGMVKVEYVLGEEGKRTSGWIPVAGIYTGKEYGSYFLPEVGTQVVIAFQMGDINAPIVIASLWNQKSPIPADAANEKNTVKQIKTKGGHTLIFSEEEGKERLQLSTPGGQALVIEDEKKCIEIADKDKKNVVMIDGENGVVRVSADKKLELSVGGKALVILEAGKVTIKAGDITIEGEQALKLKGQQLAVTGGTADISADGKLALKSSAMLQINGSMVKIN
ncbi:MAG: phage baseplate assembly protein V [Hungatella sp.]